MSRQTTTTLKYITEQGEAITSRFTGKPFWSYQNMACFTLSVDSVQLFIIDSISERLMLGIRTSYVDKLWKYEVTSTPLCFCKFVKFPVFAPIMEV